LLAPRRVLDIPIHRRLEPSLESRAWLPGELALRMTGVDGVAQIVPGPVGDEADQPLPWPGRIGPTAIDDGADPPHHIEVAALGAPAEIILAAGLAGGERQAQAAHMILDMQPVAPILAASVDRQLAARQRIEDDQRDQLLGILAGAI